VTEEQSASDFLKEVEASLPKNRHDAVRWRPRGIGLDEVPGCFVCGATVRNADAAKIGNPYLNNVAAFVAKKDEEAILGCFERGARMGYYHGDEAVPQVKVGACDRHLKALEEISRQWFISPAEIWRVVTYALAREERDAEWAAWEKEQEEKKRQEAINEIRAKREQAGG
jgi:hypothetical protein